MARTENRTSVMFPRGVTTEALSRRRDFPRPDLDASKAPQMYGGTAAFPPLPPPASLPPIKVDEAVRFLVARTTNGFTIPDYLEALELGYDGWLQRQLNHELIDDSEVESILAGFPTLTMTNKQLYETYQAEPATVVYELQMAQNLRGIYSKRQLYERMVEFWTDHFSINQLDDFCLWFKTRDDVKTVRNHALGYFPEMLKNSATSAAMLWYLDNYINIAGQVQENYARELLELHTLGVNGPYTETDIVEVARCFTGWTFHGVFTSGPFGKFTFVDSVHDQGAKTVLGVNIPANGGIVDGETVLDLLAMHPSTAEFISTKMARWLLTYDPPKALVNRLKSIYLSTGGHIKAMVEEIFSHEWRRKVSPSERIKLRRPYHLMTSVMRAAQVPSTNLLQLTVELQSMGQVPFWWPTPDGYPDSVDKWGKALLPRWTWASRLFGKDVPGNEPIQATLVDLMALAPEGSSDAEAIAWVMTGGEIDPVHVAEVQAYMDSQTNTPNIVLREAFALIASSPSYQYF